MKNLKKVFNENKALIGTIYGVSCWYGFCYLAGRGVSSMLVDHFKKHPAGKGKVVAVSAAATLGTLCLANFLGDLVGESISQILIKESQKPKVINNSMTEEDLDDMDDSEVV